MFQCKTRGNSSPQGKRRVYFSCHPEDFEKFFEQISSELLKITDCAIYYSSDDEYEDIDTDLGQMNLFVVPITTKLLTKTCRTIQLDVPFALNKHIPILPLMQEGGLDELFSRYFGDLQYLNPNARDESAISYDEKLKKYLNSILIGDELAEKVRAAFDAYIFMSYRKKDRKYANELMRLIHKNDFCRDIAIWYDEYLVPGENYSQAISDALHKSSLFTMVVTPNLVNEINYVQSVEYPEATRQNKTIIPAELEKTDHKELVKQYPNIPNCVEAHDDEALSKALETALLKIACRENDNDPQHNFFIGLAYLDGIDVEVNHERALELITSAAEAKENVVPEAIEKLVAMYKEGYGVERNYRTAAEWGSKLVEYCEDKYRESQSEEDYKNLIYALWNLGGQYYGIRDLDAAENVYRRLHSLNKHMAEETGTVEARRNLAKSYIDLGEICHERGKMDGAEEFYRKSLIILEQLTEENDTKEVIHDLIRIYNNLSRICFYRKNLDEAEVFEKKTHNLAEQLSEENSDAQARRTLSAIYTNLGRICYERGNNLDEAEEFYRKSLVIREQLSDEIGTEVRCDLSESYNTLGDICKTYGNLDEAEEFYRKSLVIREQLSEETGTVEARRDLSVSYSKLGDICKARDNLDRAEEFYRKSLAIYEQLAEETGTVEAKRLLSIIYINLGDVYKKRGKLKKAELFYRKSFIITELLVKKTTGVNYVYADLGRAYYKISVIRKPYNQKLLKKALQIYTRLAEECPNVTDYSQGRDIIKQILEKIKYGGF